VAFRAALLLLEAVQGSKRFNYHGLIRRAKFIFQVGQEFAKPCKAEFMAHGLVHECTDTAISCSLAQFIYEVTFNCHR